MKQGFKHIYVNTTKAHKKRCEKEIHDFIDSVCESNFYGEVTLYFQDGIIEHCKQLSRFSKSDIINKHKDSRKGDNNASVS